MQNFGLFIRSLRESRGLKLKQVASVIEIDQALLSKIERSERMATRKQVLSFARFFGVNERKLLSMWMGEKIANDLKDEEFAGDALKVAKRNIRNLNTNTAHV
ncbi:MAG: helix-turn-helix transcriptional regulator [Bacteroidales bacterium]|nr:helix-turn-helix transcriptional regulator [Bacteroidales bacterium]